ncbi:hypothetical protein G6F65_023060 [Rhizopus arrhizus]|nr:hypothetical protein G6F65_023060 [Rhizopus arrhizus]
MIGHIAQFLANPGDALAQRFRHLVRRAQRARHGNGAHAHAAGDILHGDAAGAGASGFTDGHWPSRWSRKRVV